MTLGAKEIYFVENDFYFCFRFPVFQKTVTLWKSFTGMVISNSQRTMLYWNVAKLVSPCGTKLEHWNGLLGTAFRWSMMSCSKWNTSNGAKRDQIWGGNTLPNPTSTMLYQSKSWNVQWKENGTFWTTGTVNLSFEIMKPFTKSS